MKKRNIINLIKFYSEGNDIAFRNEAYEIAADFNNSGDEQLAGYIMALLSEKNTFIPQSLNNNSVFLKKINLVGIKTPLIKSIDEELKGIIYAINRHFGVNKFLFSGSPGTGKTESCKYLANELNKELYKVDFNFLIDSKLGQTSKNIASLFEEINSLPNKEDIIILFDEIDSLAMDRINSHDLREMGRATSAIFKGLDELNPDTILIATTNLIDSFDKAFIRRFDKVIDFNRYNRDDLLDISVKMMDEILSKAKNCQKNTRLFYKIMKLKNPIPYPGELYNLIRSSVAFSNPENDTDYLRILMREVKPEIMNDLDKLKEEGFTVREIEVLSGISKSKIARELSGRY